MSESISRKEKYDNFIKMLKDSGSNYDIDKISRAYKLCERAHEGQFRSSGEPYFYHPVAVATILFELGMDSDTLAAALLHDVVEDTDVTVEEIEKQFGPDVAMLVSGVTKVTQIGKLPSREEQQAENIRRMLLAMSEDIRVIIIKLADRLHNMRTIDCRPQKNQLENSLETLEVYAPIAHRLGIRTVKEELEDLAIKHLDPVGYKEIEDSLQSVKEYRQQFLEKIKAKIQNRLKDTVPNAHIDGRVKSIHGIYRKMYMQGKSFDEIYDIYAVRIIVDTVNDCYNVLGIIHDIFRPLPGRFKDYISTPKPNMYQSLHTTVIDREGIPFEVQIRTWEMHRTAELGIAAHWKYKENIDKSDKKLEERLAWIRQLLDAQKESDDVEEIVHSIKTDLSQEDVFAITPKGDVINLPAGSTVIDFAYAIHSAVGNSMVGAKVDGRIVPLNHVVQTGDVIEIITTSAPGHGPSRDWLKMVKSSEARSKIRAWFKKERRSENIETGRAELEREFKRNNIILNDDMAEEFLGKIAERLHCNSVDDMYAAIGYGGISVPGIIPRIKEEYNKRVKAEPSVDVSKYVVSQRRTSTDGVIVEGIDNCLIKLSRCCDPLPGDEIIGFITRGHGVSIHKKDCPNVPKDISKSFEPDRWVKAYWDTSAKESFKSTITIMAIDRPALLADVTIALANMRVAIHAINARELKGGNCQIIITVSIESLQHLKNIISSMQKVKGVISVERTSQ